MNQIVQMFMESNNRMKRIMNGNFNLNELAAAQREFEGQIKLINAVVTAFAVSSKNKRALAGLEKMNIMDDHTAVDLMLGDPEMDKVRCPYKSELITRQDCLDYSGEARNFDECNGCEIGTKTKDILVPRQ